MTKKPLTKQDNYLSYFAYGSNMSLARLRQRAPSAQPLGPHSLAQHSLRFHKVGTDGSAKCDAFYTGNPEDQLHGALYLIDKLDRADLDKAEGLHVGYELKTVWLDTGQGHQVSAFTYYATRLDADLQPFSWYLQHVTIGAQESQLPDHYIDAIKSTPSIADPNPHRSDRELAIYQSSDRKIY